MKKRSFKIATATPELETRTPTPPTPRERPPSRIPNLHSNYVQISLKSDQSLLVKPGTLDIFSVPVIPHITSYTIPPEPVDGGVRLAVKLPDGTRLCRRFLITTKIGSVKTWVSQSAISRYTLKLAAPPATVLSDPSSSLEQMGIVHDTLVLAEELEE